MRAQTEPVAEKANSFGNDSQTSAVCLLLACLVSIIGCKPVVETDASIKRIAGTWPPYRAPSVAGEFETPRWSRLQNRARPPVRPVIDRPFPTIKPYRDWDLEETALDSLARIGEPAVPELIKALSHDDAHVRLLAADVIGRIGPESAEAVSALVRTVNTDGDEAVRKAAVRALGQIGPEAEDAVQPLMRLIGGAAGQRPALDADQSDT